MCSDFTRPRQRHRQPAEPPAPAPAPPLIAPLWFGAYGGQTSVFIDVADKTAWSATLSPGADWLSFVGASSGTGPGLVTLGAPPSTAGERHATLTAQIAGAREPLVWPITQISTEPLATLNTSVLQVPFPTVPNVMEFGIAGKFIAQEIAKLPPPIEVLVLAIVEALIPIIGELLIALRASFSAAVPEPLTWFDAPEPYNALTLAMPATAVFLSEETALLALYIPEQVAENG